MSSLLDASKLIENSNHQPLLRMLEEKCKYTCMCTTSIELIEHVYLKVTNICGYYCLTFLWIGLILYSPTLEFVGPLLNAHANCKYYSTRKACFMQKLQYNNCNALCNCRENRLLHKHPRLDKADIQLTEVNEYAVTVTNPQRVIVRGSIREKLPPALTIKSSHIRIGKSIGQGNIKKTEYLRNNNLSILSLLIIIYYL